jgi:hypothetical protein
MQLQQENSKQTGPTHATAAGAVKQQAHWTNSGRCKPKQQTTDALAGHIL